MNNNEKMSEEQIVDKMQNGEMTYVEYINQHDEDFRDEYEQYCKDNGFDPQEEDSAISFIEMKEEEFDASMED